ncbi:sugar transferase [bacterium]|nr:sugar transferase [bacterium]
MLKNHWKLVSWLERVGDNILIVAAFFFCYYWRDLIITKLGYLLPAVTPDGRPLGVLADYLIILGVGLPVYNASLSILGAYRSMRYSSSFTLLIKALISSVVVFLVISASLYMLKLDLSRSFVGLFCFISGVLLGIERLFVLRLLRIARSSGRNFRNLLVVGTGTEALKVRQELSRLPELGVRIVGFVALDSVTQSNLEIIANPATFEDTLKAKSIDEVFFTDVHANFATIQQLAQIAVEEGIRVTFAADLFSLGLAKSDTSYFAGMPLIHFNSSPYDDGRLIVKRVVDVTFSVALLALLAPLLITTALAIKFNSPGAILYRQKRVGLNGRLFTLYKFRSMVDGAEAEIKDLAQHNEMTGPVFKLKNDPRVTSLGRLLRRFSIDELPQLWNVVKGDMSLVGPRPPLPEEVSLYRRKYRRRLSMRPGLTCTWQVSGRSDIKDFEEWVKLDLEYIDQWSLTKDFILLIKTIPAVMLGTGAR